MEGIRIPVEHHRALAVYYERVMECSFALNGEEFDVSEVFHRSAFLPLIVEVASRRCQEAFSHPINAAISPHESALFGKTVALPDDTDQPILLLLIRAAELLFKPSRGARVELYPIFEYFWTPPEQRARVSWQPTDL